MQRRIQSKPRPPPRLAYLWAQRFFASVIAFTHSGEKGQITGMTGPRAPPPAPLVQRPCESRASKPTFGLNFSKKARSFSLENAGGEISGNPSCTAAVRAEKCCDADIF